MPHEQVTKPGGPIVAPDKGKKVSSGVLVTTAAGELLLGKASGSPRWDIPKGLVEPGEDWQAAAIRELEEETGLIAPPAALTPLGSFLYLPNKNLVLFSWRPSDPVDPSGLRCRSVFTTRDGRVQPELERFALVAWEQVATKVGKSLARVLASIDPASLFP